MTSKAAPKPSSKKDAPAKAPGPKLVAENLKGIGHNSGAKNPQVIKFFDEMDTIELRMKQDGKNLREIRNRLKTEFGILNQTTAHERKLRKLDADVRVQFESNHDDLKKMLGYQPSLDFQGGVATNASVKAQPAEAELTQQAQPTSFHVEDGDEGNTAEGGATATGTAGEEMPPVPDSLKRSGVITREG